MLSNFLAGCGRPTIVAKVGGGNQHSSKSPAMDFAQQEDMEGLRYAWNAWPSSRIEAARLVRTGFQLAC